MCCNHGKIPADFYAWDPEYPDFLKKLLLGKFLDFNCTFGHRRIQEYQTNIRGKKQIISWNIYEQ